MDMGLHLAEHRGGNVGHAVLALGMFGDRGENLLAGFGMEGGGASRYDFSTTELFHRPESPFGER